MSLCYKSEFIQNLKFYRSQRGISQAKLAEKCNVQPGTIGCIESGRQYPSFKLLFEMSDILGIHPADLFMRDSSRHQEQEFSQKYFHLLCDLDSLLKSYLP